MSTRIVFMGSPEFALPSLKALVDHYQVVGVVTQPDKPAGRGRALKPPEVKRLAEELKLPLIQPVKIRLPEAMAQLRAWKPDLIVYAAFGQILRQVLLDLPVYGCINVHASLLPRWRGAAPIQAAILNGDDITGITIMRADAGIDTGAILSQRSILILPEDTAGSLSLRLSTLGAELLIETLPAYLDGKIQLVNQDHDRATKAPMLMKEDGLLDFSQPALRLARMVRAYQPWPGAYVIWQGQMFKLHRVHAVSGEVAQPGKEIIWQGVPGWGTAEGLLVVDQIQPAGKRMMAGADFLRGARSWGKV